MFKIFYYETWSESIDDLNIRSVQAAYDAM